MLEILHVEDDEGHAELVRRNLRRMGVQTLVTAVSRGQDALDFLFFRGHYRHRARGNLLVVLLDINMPGAIDGLEVLKRIKTDPTKRRTPVIMLTTTDDRREMERCYDLGCNVYLTKPIDPRLFTDAVQQLGMLMDVMTVPTEIQGTHAED